jgi:hypothetical protein
VGMLSLKALHVNVPTTAVPKLRIKVCSNSSKGYTIVYND